MAFSECIFRGKMTVEGVTATRVPSSDTALQAPGQIPVLVDPDGAEAAAIGATVLIDARMAKRNLGTRITDAPVVIGLGPGFTAGVDAHAVVETARGHYLGQVIYHGSSQEFTGVPGAVGGYTTERLLRAPIDGTLRTINEIGSRVEVGQIVAEVVAGAVSVPIRAAIPGILRGLLRDGAPVSKGQKVGDIDPRIDPQTVWHISDKARAVGGGVLEAIMCLLWGRPPAAPAVRATPPTVGKQGASPGEGKGG